MTTADKKIHAIKLLNEGETYSAIYHKTGISYKTLKRYSSILEKEGIEAVLSPEIKYYQPAEKARAAIDVLNGRAVSDVAMELGASEYTVRRWVARYRVGGIEVMKDGRLQRKGSRVVSAQQYELLANLQGTINNNNQ